MLCYKKSKIIQLVALSVLMLFSTYAHSQGATVGNMAGRANVNNLSSQINTLNTIIKSMNTAMQSLTTRVNNTELLLNKVTICNDEGMIYDPNSSSADSSGCIENVPEGNQIVYECPMAGSANGVTAGPWGYYGCRGQIGLANRCQTIVYPQSQWRDCSPIGKVYVD